MRILATRSEMRLPDDTRILATRSEMRLHQCDAHLECARLALAEGHQAREHVAAARRLVDETGYGRRPEVEDLETQARCKSRLSSSLQVAPDSQWPTCELDRDP